MRILDGVRRRSFALQWVSVSAIAIALVGCSSGAPLEPTPPSRHHDGFISLAIRLAVASSRRLIAPYPDGSIAAC